MKVPQWIVRIGQIAERKYAEHRAEVDRYKLRYEVWSSDQLVDLAATRFPKAALFNPELKAIYEVLQGRGEDHLLRDVWAELKQRRERPNGR